ncbi:MAG: 3-oxoacyl-[acyl-carrier-protein] reductase FabG [Bryobacteraceae bacterium]|nr:3-oxoacyl-[acyl-carrier-protein] reductase FabG [Bryobacteraceae bacterium]
MSLAQKIAIVTGGARGIGRATAAELARAGCDVAFCDIAASAPETVKEIESAGSRALYLTADTGERAQMEAMFDEVVSRWGRLDILVNNAAINIRKPLLELEVDDVAAVWKTTLWGVFHCSQLAARQMVNQGAGGAIVMISSIHAARGFPGSTAYNGAKAAVNQMAATWASELAAHRIRVNSIEPGWTDTPGERKFFTEEYIREQGRLLPLGRLAKPEEIAAAVKFLVSDEAAYITGSVLRVDGGLMLPR